MGMIHEIDGKGNLLDDGQRITVVDNGRSTTTYFGYPKEVGGILVMHIVDAGGLRQKRGEVEPGSSIFIPSRDGRVHSVRGV